MRQYPRLRENRSKVSQDIFDELDELQTQHDNFNWHAVLSDPSEDDDWQGLTGFVHVSVRENVLDAIDNCSEFEYYICGPPPMLAATRTLLAEYGVPETRVFFDDFGI